MLVNASGTSTNEIGFITCGGKKLIIADAAASWNAKKKELNVYLSPYKLTTQDLEDVKRGGMWAPGSDKDSPDNKLWGDDCPSAQITIEFSAGEPSPRSATYYNFAFYRFVKKLTANDNRNAADIPKVIQSLKVENNHLILRSKGSEELFDEKYTWGLSLACPIFDVEEQ
jgi:hypothetical protein